MDLITALGMVAATCTTIAFLPQVVKNWKRKTAGDLSFGTFGLFSIGLGLWLTYGVLIDNWPIILSNLITLILNVANLVQMVWYRKIPPQATLGPTDLL
jgi:MtN3 and saliva related transmembrane protein